MLAGSAGGLVFLTPERVLHALRHDCSILCIYAAGCHCTQRNRIRRRRARGSRHGTARAWCQYYGRVGHNVLHANVGRDHLGRRSSAKMGGRSIHQHDERLLKFTCGAQKNSYGRFHCTPSSAVPAAMRYSRNLSSSVFRSCTRRCDPLHAMRVGKPSVS